MLKIYIFLKLIIKTLDMIQIFNILLIKINLEYRLEYKFL